MGKEASRLDRAVGRRPLYQGVVAGFVVLFLAWSCYCGCACCVCCVSVVPWLVHKPNQRSLGWGEGQAEGAVCGRKAT